MTILLMDADIQAFEAGMATSDWIEFEEGEGFWDCDLEEAKRCFDDLLTEAQDITLPDQVIMTVSDPGRLYFRHDLAPSYKAGRNEKRPRPPVIAQLKHWLIEERGAKWRPKLEGDDVLGILHTANRQDTLVWSLDKDLATIPGRMIRAGRLDSFEHEEVFIEEPDADRWWLMQALMGDPTDGYKGCPGIGPKRASRILEPCVDLPEMWAAVVETYASKGLTADDALVQARLARILRAADWCFDTSTVRLWRPPV